MIKLEQVGQLVKQDGPRLSHDDLLDSNLSKQVSNSLNRFTDSYSTNTLNNTSVSFTLSGLQTPSVM